MKRAFTTILILHFFAGFTQTWPSENWSSANNLTNVMDAAGVTELSGLYWNPINNRLFGIQNNGNLRVLELNATTNTFSQIANKTISGGPEGITQANLYANEFYTIDEAKYEIRTYTYTTNFSKVSLYKHWNLLLSPSTMTDTGNTGPEGIVFIPDTILIAIGFISQKTGQAYTSAKGLGGLFFVANQDGGYIWVFDVNPNSNDDFAFVGKYKTNRSESCDLSLDRSTGLLYILHNISGNKLEVTDLSTFAVSGNERKFVVKKEYAVPNPGDTNENIEGFAVTPKCPDSGTVSAWLCRDVKASESSAIQQDVLRWFTSFTSDGTCTPLSNADFKNNIISVYPNPASKKITISSENKNMETIQICNTLGQIVLKKENIKNPSTTIDISQLQAGIYSIEITQDRSISIKKFMKN